MDSARQYRQQSISRTGDNWQSVSRHAFKINYATRKDNTFSDLPGLKDPKRKKSKKSLMTCFFDLFKNKQYHVKVQASSFHLNSHTLEIHLQT